MNRTFVRDLLQARLLFIGEVALNNNCAFDTMNEAFKVLLALDAILDVNSLLAQAHRDALDGPALTTRVEHRRHRNAAAERGEQERVRVWPCAVASHARGFVNDERLAVAVAHLVLKFHDGSDRDFTHRFEPSVLS